MSVPYPAPAGFKWVRSILGLFGDWVLVEDDEFPLPPEGFRYVPHPLTAKPTLIATRGPGVDFGLGDNAAPKPARFGYYGTGLAHVDVKPIDPSKISPEVHAVEGLQEGNVVNRPGNDVFKPRTREGAAIFG